MAIYAAIIGALGSVLGGVLGGDDKPKRTNPAFNPGLFNLTAQNELVNELFGKVPITYRTEGPGHDTVIFNDGSALRLSNGNVAWWGGKKDPGKNRGDINDSMAARYKNAQNGGGPVGQPGPTGTILGGQSLFGSGGGAGGGLFGGGGGFSGGGGAYSYNPRITTANGQPMPQFTDTDASRLNGIGNFLSGGGGWDLLGLKDRNGNLFGSPALEWITNPAGKLLTKIFGTEKGYPNKYKSGTMNLNYGMFSPYDNGTLTPIQALGRRYVYGETQNPFQTTFPVMLGNAALAAFDNPQNGILRNEVNFAEEAARTGFKTDIEPIIKEEMRRYNEETLPLLKEQFAPATGLFATDFLGAGEREGAAMGTRLGTKEYDANEAAANRRMQAIPLSSAIKQANIAIPLNLGTDIFSLGSSLERLDPSVRLLESLGLLTQIGANNQYIQPGFPANASTSGLDALASSIPTIASGLGDILSSMNQPIYPSSVPSGASSDDYQSQIDDMFKSGSATDLFGSIQGWGGGTNNNAVANIFGAGKF